MVTAVQEGVMAESNIQLPDEPIYDISQLGDSLVLKHRKAGGLRAQRDSDTGATMRAITICEPHASYICGERLPPGILERKRVENRTWECKHRGPLLIHSGAGKKWLRGVPIDEIPDGMKFGAIIGVVDVVACVQYANPGAMTWLYTHEHACGPWCIIMHHARRFPEPIPYKGCLGVWEVPDEVVAEQLAKAVPCG